MSTQEKSIPSNFRSLISDFTRDLSTTFPEYSYMWSKWGNEDTTDDELETLYKFSCKIYPVRFFDILYQNEDIFKEDSGEDVYFFPNMSFRLIFNSEGLSETSKKVIWKYLQLILFTVVGTLDDKENFGETANMFEGIDENELQEKINETMLNITGFFEKMNGKGEGEGDGKGEDKTSNENATGDNGMPNSEEFRNMFNNLPNMEGMPNIEGLFGNLQSLLDGKIGALAKEMAEEIAEDFKNELGQDIDNAANPQDILKQLMKNPAKISKLMKTVTGKLDSKMKDGSISKDEIMKEAGDMMNKMKEMGGTENFKEMFQNMSKSMGLGKNVKFDQNKLDRMMKKEDTKKKMMDKADIRREKIKQDNAAELEQMKQRRREQIALQQKYSLTETDNPNHLVFKLDGETGQERSFTHPDLVKMIEEDEQNKQNSMENKKKKKKKKKKA
jgi:hypothetical protein